MKSNPEKIRMVFEMEIGSEIWSSKEKYQGICYYIYNGTIYKYREYIDFKGGRGLFISYYDNGKKYSEYYFKWPAIECLPDIIKGEYKYWNKNGELENFHYYIDKNDKKYKDAEKYRYTDDLNYLDLFEHPEYIEQYDLNIRF